jgi:hypothetical protein
MIEPPLENEPRQSSWSPFFVKLRCRQEGFQSPCIARISALIHSLSSFQIHGRILRHRCYFNLSPNRRFCNYGRSLIMINSHRIQSTKFEEPVTCLVGDCLRTRDLHCNPPWHRRVASDFGCPEYTHRLQVNYCHWKPPAFLHCYSKAIHTEGKWRPTINFSLGQIYINLPGCQRNSSRIRDPTSRIIDTKWVH